MGKYEQLIYNHLHLSHTLDELQQIFKCGLACYEGQLADAEIAQLQREKAELQELLLVKQKEIGECKYKTEELEEYISSREAAYDDLQGKYYSVIADNSLLNVEHTTLVERVKVHNENIANMDKHFPSSAWKTYLIDLDTQEGGK